MSENNLSSLISSLAENKEISEMVQKFKESGDFASVLGEVSSLLGGLGGEALSGISPNGEAENNADAQSYDLDDNAKEEAHATQGDGCRENYTQNENEAEDAELFRSLGERESGGSGSDGGGGGSGDSNGANMGALFGGLLPLFSKSITENSALLLALKPYLSKKRCDLIDSIIKISKLASIVSLAK